MRHAVILTGATGGVGRFLYEEVGNCKNVSICYPMFRNPKKWEEIQMDHSEGVEIRPICCNLEGNVNIIQELDSTCDKITLVLAAFEIKPIENIGSYKENELCKSIKTNIEGQVCLVNQIVNFSIQNDIQLNIINFDSGAAYHPIQGWGIYCSCKAFMNMFLQVLKMEKPWIRVISYEPGIIDTPMQQAIREVDPAVFSRVEEFREYDRNGKLNSPKKIAQDVCRRFIDTWSSTSYQERYTEL